MKKNKVIGLAAIAILLVGGATWVLGQNDIPCATIEEKVLALYDEEKVEFECGNFESIPFEELPQRSDRVHITSDILEETKEEFPNAEDAFVIYEGDVLKDGELTEIECIDSKINGTFDCNEV